MQRLSQTFVFLLGVSLFFLLIPPSWLFHLLASSASFLQGPSLPIATSEASDVVFRPHRTGNKIPLSSHPLLCRPHSRPSSRLLLHSSAALGEPGGLLRRQPSSFRRTKLRRPSVVPHRVQHRSRFSPTACLSEIIRPCVPTLWPSILSSCPTCIAQASPRFPVFPRRLRRSTVPNKKRTSKALQRLSPLLRPRRSSPQTRSSLVAGLTRGTVNDRHPVGEEHNTTPRETSPPFSSLNALVSVPACRSLLGSISDRNKEAQRTGSKKRRKSFWSLFPFSVFFQSVLSAWDPHNEEVLLTLGRKRGPEACVYVAQQHSQTGTRLAVYRPGVFDPGRLARTTEVQERHVSFEGGLEEGVPSRPRGRSERFMSSAETTCRESSWQSSSFSASLPNGRPPVLKKTSRRGCQLRISRKWLTVTAKWGTWRNSFSVRPPRRKVAIPLCFVGLDLVKIFGRLADISTVGSVIASPVASPALAAPEILGVYERLVRELNTRRTTLSDSVEFPTRGRKKDVRSSRERGIFSRGSEDNSSAASSGVEHSRPVCSDVKVVGIGNGPNSSSQEGKKRTLPCRPGERDEGDWEAWLASERVRWLSNTQESMLVQKTGALKRRGTPNRGRASSAPRKKWELLFLPSLPQERGADRGKDTNGGAAEEASSTKVGGVRSEKPETSLDRTSFEEKLLGMKFTWPLQPNAGAALCPTVQYMPAAYSVFLEVARGLHNPRNDEGEEDLLGILPFADARAEVAHKSGRALARSRGRSMYDRVGTALQNSPVASDAIDCVWRALTRVMHGPYGEVLPLGVPPPHPDLGALSSSNPARRLCRGDLLRSIWEWAPADGLVDWESFLFFLDQVPTDGAERLLN